MTMRNGFSMLEMLICVSIILVFASFAVPKFTSATKTAQEAKVQADIRTISNAAALYEIDHGEFRRLSTSWSMWIVKDDSTCSLSR